MNVYMIRHSKSLGKCYSTMFFSKTSTETLPSKNPKTLKVTLKHGMSMKNVLTTMTYYISLERS